MNEPFHFSFSTSRNLPRLAWCLQLQAGSTIARVDHGEWLETSEYGFCEGAWAGEYAKAEFDLAFMTGTGAKICGNGLMLATPSHTLDRLNALRKDDTLYVSNSLAFLLAASGEELDPDFPFYDSYVSSIKFGLKAYERTIVTRSGARVRFYYACNLLITDELALVENPKNASPTFVDYSHYKSYIDEVVGRIVRNACDPLRKTRFTPLATVSRGYDSPAAMVIANQADCREAFSFRNSRGTIADSDCGTVIAEKVDVAVRDFDRLEYCHRADFPEILNSGGPNEFLSFGDNLAGRLLFTGFHGDKVWDKNCQKVTTELVRGDSSGASLTESRLQAGFCHLPIPFIGADSHPSIHAISNSLEMAKWSLGNSYDRPIPRRIVEDAGVPRDLFGQKKRAAGVVVPVETLARTMSSTSLKDFQEFCKVRCDSLKSFKMRCLKVIKKFVRYNQAAANVAARIRRRLKLNFISIPIVVPHQLEMLTFGYLGTEAYLFHWGVEKLILRYRAALKELGTKEEIARSWRT